MKKIIIAICSCYAINAMGQNLPVYRPIDGFIAFGTENALTVKDTTILTVKKNGEIIRGETPIDQLPAEELIKIIKELITVIARK